MLYSKKKSRAENTQFSERFYTNRPTGKQQAGILHVMKGRTHTGKPLEQVGEIPYAAVQLTSGDYCVYRDFWEVRAAVSIVWARDRAATPVSIKCGTLLEAQLRTERHLPIVMSATDENDFVTHFRSQTDRPQESLDSYTRIECAVYVVGAQSARRTREPGK